MTHILQALLQLDGDLLLWIQNDCRTPLLTSFFTFLTHLGDSGGIWLVLSCVLLISKRTRAVGIMSLTALASSFLINNLILKNLVARIRPYEVLQGLTLLIERQSDFSFPSGHTASSFAAAVIIYRELPHRYGIAALILAAGIGFSRLYLGVHYPSDVISGALSGILIAVLVSKCFRTFTRQEALP